MIAGLLSSQSFQHNYHTLQYKESNNAEVKRITQFTRDGHLGSVNLETFGYAVNSDKISLSK